MPAGVDRNLVLAGFMATGKSAVGRICARRLGFRFVDLDAEIEAALERPIPDIFRDHGEAYFRDAESAAAARVAQRRAQVISTGGGAMLRPQNRDALATTGVIVCLWADVETIARRVAGTGHRPLLGGSAPATDAELIERVRRLLEERRPVYELFPRQVCTAGLSMEQSADRVIALYRAACEEPA